LKKLCREHFAIFAAAQPSPLTGFGIYPGYSIDYQKSADVVAHGSSTFNKPTFSQDSSFFAAPHRAISRTLLCVLI
jgi:hypothetical protein